ncbi:DUF2147 domain-containing protein [Paraburkholderia sp. Se-20369]|nr:DUF2147 domain-containing protein [Paraburkholderia sp. Se-20369]
MPRRSWRQGRFARTSTGRTYRCKATVDGGKMRLSGYVGVPALGQTRAFHRVSP